MTRPGFRKSRSGASRSGVDRGDGFLSSSLFSQAQILHLMKAEFARARRHGFALGCVLLQVDRMPQLVDLYGLELRQTVRDALGRLVREKTRGADLLGAISEDRYLLVLPHSDREACRSVARRLHELFADLEVTADGRPLVLTASVGFAAIDPEQQTIFFDTLVGQAEAALEWAVERGGNRVVSFGETQLLGGADAPGVPDRDPGAGSGPGSGADRDGDPADRPAGERERRP